LRRRRRAIGFFFLFFVVTGFFAARLAAGTFEADRLARQYRASAAGMARLRRRGLERDADDGDELLDLKRRAAACFARQYRASAGGMTLRDLRRATGAGLT
jgi:hypothetical protein